MARRRPNWLWWLAGLSLAAYLSPGVYDRARYGRKVGLDAPDGDYLRIAPKVLATTAGVSADVYSLGRAIRSEAGRRSEPERIAVAWAIVNEARARGKTVTDTITAGGRGAGYYAGQDLGGRYVSSRFAPLTADLQLAGGILGGRIRDNTGGARRFFAPSVQDKLVSMGRKGYTKTAADVIARWARDGYAVRAIPGVDPRDFVVFVKGAPSKPRDLVS